MAQRQIIKKSGYNVNTLLEIMFRGGGRSLSSGTGLNNGKLFFDFATADYIADTSVADANFRIDVKHYTQSNVYLWDVLKLENSGAILYVDFWKGENTLSRWFYANTKDIRVIISP